MKFTAKQDAARGEYIYKVESADLKGRRVWHFIRVMPAKLKAFLKIGKLKAYDLKDYGEILASGYGGKPPRGVVEEINQRYHVDFAA